MKITKIERRERRLDTSMGVRRGLMELRSKVRVYVFYEGENILDNLRNRTTRPHVLYRKEVLPAVRQLLGLRPETKFAWSQRAGCSCGCSPGFIASDLWGYDVLVYITDAPVTTNPEVAAARF